MSEVAPWALDGVSLGERTLEIGPGPGFTSEAVRPLTPDLVCAELDARLARELAGRLGNPHARVLRAHASALPLRDGAFDSVVAFTMLHHVTPESAQDALFAEAARVLRPGGVFAGVDSLNSAVFRLLHWRDPMVIVPPDGLLERLQRAGFARAEITVRRRDFRFRAWRAQR